MPNSADISDTIPARSGRRWLGFVLVGLAVSGIFGIIVVLTFGRVSGTEFDPVTTDQRSFVYYQIPVVHIPLSPVFRYQEKTRLGRYLILNRHWSNKGKSHWDLVSVDSVGEEADAAILLRFFEAYNKDGQLYWQEWTKDHPDQAKLLWPAVEILAKESLYPYVTVLFETVHSTEDVETFRKQARQQLVPLIQRDLRIAQRQSDRDRAARLRRAAAELWPDDPNWTTSAMQTSGNAAQTP